MGMLGTTLLVDVPAALWECLGQGLDPPSLKTGGRPTQASAGTNPRTGQAPCYFLSLAGPPCSLVSGPNACRRSLAWYAVPHSQVQPRAVLFISVQFDGCSFSSVPSCPCWLLLVRASFLVTCRVFGTSVVD